MCNQIFLCRPSGGYYLKDDSGKPYLTYCHMEPIPGCGEGPWALVLKADGHKVRNEKPRKVHNHMIMNFCIVHLCIVRAACENQQLQKR